MKMLKILKEAKGTQFKIGDIVRYTGKFLKSVGMYVGGPINGQVKEMAGSPGSHFSGWPKIQWNDAEEGDLMMVNPVNLELDPTVPQNKGKQNLPKSYID